MHLSQYYHQMYVKIEAILLILIKFAQTERWKKTVIESRDCIDIADEVIAIQGKKRKN